jgi:hypothetical protein
MPQLLKSQSTNAEAVDSSWRGLYRIGAAAAFAMVVMYLVSMAVYFPAYSRGPPPASVHEWLVLF